MRKALFIIASFLTLSLGAAEPSVKPMQMKIHQMRLFMGGYGAVYNQAMDICQKRGYKYFKLAKLSYKDGLGQTMEIKGIITDKSGELIKESVSDSDIPQLGNITCNFEIMGYKNEPKDELACDVGAYYQMIQQYSAPMKKVEGSKVVDIKSFDELQKEIKSSKVPVLVECYSTYCPPCKMLAPIYDEHSIKNENVKFLKVNTQDVKEITELYQIRGVPTLLIFEKEGKLQEKKIGLPDITGYLDSLSVQISNKYFKNMIAKKI